MEELFIIDSRSRWVFEKATQFSSITGENLPSVLIMQDADLKPGKVNKRQHKY